MKTRLSEQQIKVNLSARLKRAQILLHELDKDRVNVLPAPPKGKAWQIIKENGTLFATQIPYPKNK